MRSPRAPISTSTGGSATNSGSDRMRSKGSNACSSQKVIRGVTTFESSRLARPQKAWRQRDAASLSSILNDKGSDLPLFGGIPVFQGVDPVAYDRKRRVRQVLHGKSFPDKFLRRFASFLRHRPRPAPGGRRMTWLGACPNAAYGGRWSVRPLSLPRPAARNDVVFSPPTRASRPCSARLAWWRGHCKNAGMR